MNTGNPPYDNNTSSSGGYTGGQYQDTRSSGGVKGTGTDNNNTGGGGYASGGQYGGNTGTGMTGTTGTGDNTGGGGGYAGGQQYRDNTGAGTTGTGVRDDTGGGYGGGQYRDDTNVGTTGTTGTTTDTAQRSGGDPLDKGVDYMGKKTGHEQSHGTTEKISDTLRKGYNKMTGKDAPVKDQEYK